ncbi:MAG: hypothetical protein WCQ99_04660 [Pseudomonadota bacterium]
MKKICLPVVIIILLYSAFVCAQSDSDTDPNRWKQVKSWQGTFTFTSGQQDDVTLTSDPQFIQTSTARVSLNGNFILDQKDTTVTDLSTWSGQGQVTGSIYILQETKALDGSSVCTTETKGDQPLAPLENTPGYSLQWDYGGGDKGKYFFETGIFMIKDIVTQICNGETFPLIYQDWAIGGATTINWKTLPASGYNITGDEVINFNGSNNGHFHWALQPKEFNPAPPVCAFETVISDRATLNILRAVRNALTATPTGIQLVYLYYANVAEVTKIIAADCELRGQFRELIINNTKYAQELSAENATTIPCETAKELISFLTKLKARGTPKLNKDIAWVLQGIADTSLLDLLGIRVTETNKH